MNGYHYLTSTMLAANPLTNSPHPVMVTLKQSAIFSSVPLHDALYKLHLKKNIPPQYYNVLAHGLYLGHGYSGGAQPPAQSQVDEEVVQQIKQDQEKLGWKQLYYGCITCAWAHSLTTSITTINGIVFYSRVQILLIWQAVLNQWQVHNQHLHPPNHMEEDCTQLKCMVYQVLQEAQADPNMHELIASVNPNELLN